MLYIGYLAHFLKIFLCFGQISINGILWVRFSCEISDFYLTGADATICVKSTCYNLCKAGYSVSVLSDCISSWDKKKIPEMLDYYKSKGGNVICLNELLG